MGVFGFWEYVCRESERVRVWFLSGFRGLFFEVRIAEYERENWPGGLFRGISEGENGRGLIFRVSGKSPG